MDILPIDTRLLWPLLTSRRQASLLFQSEVEASKVAEAGKVMEVVEVSKVSEVNKVMEPQR